MRSELRYHDVFIIPACGYIGWPLLQKRPIFSVKITVVLVEDYKAKLDEEFPA